MTEAAQALMMRFELAQGKGEVAYVTSRITGIEDTNGVDYDNAPLSRLIVDTGAHSVLAQMVRGRATQHIDRIVAGMEAAMLAGAVNLLGGDRLRSVQDGIQRAVQGELAALVRKNTATVVAETIDAAVFEALDKLSGEEQAAPKKAGQAKAAAPKK